MFINRICKKIKKKAKCVKEDDDDPVINPLGFGAGKLIYDYGDVLKIITLQKGGLTFEPYCAKFQNFPFKFWFLTWQGSVSNVFMPAPGWNA